MTVWIVVMALPKLIEEVSSVKAGSRWTATNKVDPVPAEKHSGINCVREADLGLLLSKLRECPNKTAILGTLGVETDHSKVREVVIHAGGTEVRIEVIC
jgi:hypothetical protein